MIPAYSEYAYSDKKLNNNFDKCENYCEQSQNLQYNESVLSQNLQYIESVLHPHTPIPSNNLYNNVKCNEDDNILFNPDHLINTSSQYGPYENIKNDKSYNLPPNFNHKKTYFCNNYVEDKLNKLDDNKKINVTFNIDKKFVNKNIDIVFNFNIV